MPRNKDDDHDHKKKGHGHGGDDDHDQPGPPPIEDKGGEGDYPWKHKHHHLPWDHAHWEHQAAESIYEQLIHVREVVDKLERDAQQAALKKRLEMVPVRTSDLMRGFQAAVARANQAVSAGDSDSENIASMSIKDLEIALEAPLIEGAHAEDPVIMLPNIKSVDSETAKVSLKFSIVSVPGTQRG